MESLSVDSCAPGQRLRFYLESRDIYVLPFYNLIARSLVNLNENICVNQVIRGLRCFVLKFQITS